MFTASVHEVKNEKLKLKLAEGISLEQDVIRRG
jgi:hypothetical protein